MAAVEWLLGQGTGGDRSKRIFSARENLILTILLPWLLILEGQILTILRACPPLWGWGGKGRMENRNFLLSLTPDLWLGFSSHLDNHYLTSFMHLNRGCD